MCRSLVFTCLSVALTIWRIYFDNDSLMVVAVLFAMAALWFALSELNEIYYRKSRQRFFRFVPVVSAGIAGYELFILYLAEKAGGG